MRIRINFTQAKIPQVMPLNYQYPLSAWIYKVLARGDSEFAGLLHQAGYQLENQKTFKLFTFSNLQIPAKGFRILKGTDRMEITGQKLSLIVTFMLPDALQTFVAGLFLNQHAGIGDKISVADMHVKA